MCCIGCGGGGGGGRGGALRVLVKDELLSGEEGWGALNWLDGPVRDRLKNTLKPMK